jgi:hypothetical protein
MIYLELIYLVAAPLTDSSTGPDYTASMNTLFQHEAST